MITTHVHHVAEIRGSEAVKLASATPHFQTSMHAPEKSRQTLWLTRFKPCLTNHPE
jgi:hypothetical protein